MASEGLEILFAKLENRLQKLDAKFFEIFFVEDFREHSLVEELQRVEVAEEFVEVFAVLQFLGFFDEFGVEFEARPR